MITLNADYGILYNNENGVFVLNGASPSSCFYNFNCYNLYAGKLVNKIAVSNLADSLQNDKFNHSLIINAAQMYANCSNLTGSPVCGSNVTNAMNMYANCYNITGSPVCGSNVINASEMYYNCTNITGSPVCGSNVTTASNMYYNCSNLTDPPVCGNNVINAPSMYYNCTNITGSPVCGSNVKNVLQMYFNCRNLTGGADLYLSKCNNLYYMLNGVPNFNRKNIYVNNSLIYNFNNNATTRIVNGIIWTPMTNGYYNEAHNIYVYTNAQ